MAEEDKIIVIGTIEDDEFDNKPFKRVIDKDGNAYKIKQGRGGKLKEKWPLLEEGLAIKLIFGEYTNPSGVKFPFVEDFELVKDGLPAPTTPMPPTASVGDTTPKTPPDTTVPPPPPAPQAVGKGGYKADPAKMDSIERQVSIKLACDISSDTETLEQIFNKANKIYQWISKA